ncbi:exopolysaccharide biosynthesis polyprenyl glycosylphosphotransferase [Xanthocytophaga flava]|uniref:exopolysaccharide biosynthesis polyprenyl glycosylphosphotransferase n=1 Tax=Xanthocytophaga flava TaxID=3048013 RepID=UPI0028D6572F|nr:exopolysaccharide biosynthesis polyprenyl glycosylphosphotransferase [Xanthocytophaga flavus]MDJ1467006.1 exopolysaccharide biosynthesis polyprenyl glycosylphosphotransferase [Xanthocytophaga flavus]
MKEFVLQNNVQGNSLSITNYAWSKANSAVDTRSNEWGRFLLLGIESLIIYGVFKFLLDLHPARTVHLKITYPLIALVFCLAWWVFAFLPSKSYLRRGFSFKEGISFSNLWGPLLLHGSMVGLILSALRLPIGYYPFFIQSYLGIIVLLIVARGIYQVSYQRGLQLASGKFVVVSSGIYSQELVNKLTRKWGESKFAGSFDHLVDPNKDFEEEFQKFREYCIEHQIQHIFISLPAHQQEQVEAISHFAGQCFIRCLILPNSGYIWPEQKNICYVGDLVVCDQWLHPLQNKFNTILKRIFDIVFSLMVIVFIFSWLIPIIALAVKLSSPGPIFFVQHRPGKRNKAFKCLKFRTMRVNNQSEVQATFKDPRVTAVGQFLRKTSLDELPQFFNVLVGDMSIVGPRPNMVSQLEYYSKLIPEYPLRHAVAPGITGYAQVKGYRGETRELYLMQKRVDFDLAYIRKWNFLFDIKIIFLTVKNMIVGEKFAY